MAFKLMVLYLITVLIYGEYLLTTCNGILAVAAVT